MIAIARKVGHGGIPLYVVEDPDAGAEPGFPFVLDRGIAAPASVGVPLG